MSDSFISKIFKEAGLQMNMEVLIIRTNDETKYELMYNNQSDYDGVFFTAVKTTGIYCLPSCSAIKPKKENVEFFDNFKEVEAAGYRPCKICNPDIHEIIWEDHKTFIEIQPPKEFDFEQCLVYMNRSDIESLHKVINQEIYKLVKFENIYILIKIGINNENIRVSFLNITPPKWIRAKVVKYVWDMFDLGTDLILFYEKTNNDEILNLLINKYKGLRIIKINDLFEGLCWGIIGQQINLKFAYTLKKRLVEKYGEMLTYENEDYFIFPDPREVAKLKIEDLRELQFTSRKAEYVIGLAKLFEEKIISKQKLELENDYESLRNKLTSIRGIGNWTADYAILKCFNINCAFPIADVGIHNALKSILGLDRKPEINQIEKLALNWKGWEAYATFYIWRWLYD